MEVDSELAVDDKLRCAVSELMFVLIPDMRGSLKVKNPAMLPIAMPTLGLTSGPEHLVAPTGRRAFQIRPVSFVFGFFELEL
jgi:hypothetical protein